MKALSPKQPELILTLEVSNTNQQPEDRLPDWAGADRSFEATSPHSKGQLREHLQANKLGPGSLTARAGGSSHDCRSIRVKRLNDVLVFESST